MPGKRCNVASCNNSFLKTKQCLDTRHIMYHSFPSDPEVRKKWIYLCGRDGKWNPDTCAVCSEHFIPEDYARDLRSELLNLPPKKRLKNSAVPSRRLRPDESQEKIDENVVSRRNRKDRRDQRKLVREILSNDRDIETGSQSSELIHTCQYCYTALESDDHQSVMMEFPEVFSSLVEKYSLKIESRCVKQKGSKMVIRSTINNESDARDFLTEFENLTLTSFVASYESRNPPKVAYRKSWVCRHSNGKQRQSSKNCHASIDLVVKGGASKGDAFLKETPPLPCVIRMNLEHSHPVSEMAASLRTWVPIKCENLQVSVDPKICSLVQNNRQQSDLISEAQLSDSEDQIIHTSIIKIEPVSDEEIAEENHGTSESSNDMLNSSQLAIETILVKKEVEDGS